MSQLHVRESFEGKSVLITGATGFIGKVLVEKLLKDCTGVKNVYIFFRGKRGLDYQTRFEKFLTSIVFHKINEKDQKLINKLIPIKADINDSKSLGISEDDLVVLRKEVSIVFHLAATIKFKEPVEIAINTNTIATRTLVEIVKTFDKLDVFVYMSTAFSNTIRKTTIGELIHDSTYDYKKAIDIVERKDSAELQVLSKTALNLFPNTYTFSKHLTEQMMNDYSKEMPIVVVRPSIVSPAVAEPAPGWVDSMGTIMSVYVGHSTGMLRVLHINEKISIDFIPVDFVANTTIVTAAEMIFEKDKQIKVYNSSMAKEIQCSFKEHLESYEKTRYFEKYPSNIMVWVPNLHLTENYIYYLFNFVLFQMLPSIFLDLILILLGRTPFLVKVQKMIFKSMEQYKYFMFNHWIFDHQKLFELFDRLNPEEKKIFNFDGRCIDLVKYRLSSGCGIRKYVMKLDEKTIPTAQRRYRFFYWMDILVKSAFFIYVVKKIFRYVRNNFM